MDHVHEKIQALADELYAFGSENRLSLAWLFETMRERLLHHPDRDVQDYIRERLRKALN